MCFKYMLLVQERQCSFQVGINLMSLGVCLYDGPVVWVNYAASLMSVHCPDLYYNKLIQNESFYSFLWSVNMQYSSQSA